MLMSNNEIIWYVVMWTFSVVSAILITRWVVRRKQSADMVATLKQELRDEHRRHTRIEAIHEYKLAVYRDAAIKQRVKELFAEGEKLRLIVRR